ncbi:MAG: zinc ribbon domain-containing protein [Lachnospiraceae bacterium]|nr:zinc ribbon domain-containing protein [Lachnospiraceae bacterium]
MYQCLNCSGNIKFDIESQMMLCEHCGTSMDPYAVEEKRDAMESVIANDEYEVTVFSCPQCGGELLCYDDTAATFCSYCGGSTILDSRISYEKRPQYIIPFKKTKEECKEEYAKMIKRAFFVPKEMKDKDYISRFRSIYMPYWMYTMERNSRVVFNGVKHKIHDNVKFTEVYTIKTNVEAEYKGLTYDASSAFSDTLSNAIAPYHWWDAKPFTPAYLSGFYADAGDVSSDLYVQEAMEIARDDMCRRMREDLEPKKLEVGLTLEEAMTIRKPKVEMAMLPVWFLSFRHKDRVSYAVVNGQTGEVAGDLPIDKKSLLKWSFLWAIPVAFLLMLLFMKMSAPTFLVLTTALAAVCCVISCSQKREIRAKENYLDDRGKWYPVTPGQVYRVTVNLGDDVAAVLAVFVISAIAIGLKYLLAPTMSGVNGDPFSSFMTIGATFLFPLVYAIMPKGKFQTKGTANLTWRDFLDTLKKTGVGIGLSLLLLLLHPKGEAVYYILSLLTMGLIAWDIMGIIDRHNELVTREIPQFQKRGGES